MADVVVKDRVESSVIGDVAAVLVTVRREEVIAVVTGDSSVTGGEPVLDATVRVTVAVLVRVVGAPTKKVVIELVGFAEGIVSSKVVVKVEAITIVEGSISAVIVANGGPAPIIEDRVRLVTGVRTDCRRAVLKLVGRGGVSKIREDPIGFLQIKGGSVVSLVTG